MKILVISHNPFSTYQNMGKTFCSLFSSFKKKEICQLYIHKSLPDVDSCSSYYQVTDKAVAKGLFTFSVKGAIVKPDINYRKNALKDLFKKKNKNHLIDMIRDSIWGISHWYNPSLKKWIREEKPTCIFVAIGGNRFLYDIAMRISKDFSLPIVVYICDNYFSLHQKGIVNRLWLSLLQKKTKLLLRMSSCIITISKSMENYYSSFFNLPIYTVMTGSNMLLARKRRQIKQIKVIRYFGNTSLGRYKSLADICEAIDEINKEKNLGITVEIFNGAPTPEEIKVFSSIHCASFNGFLSGDDYVKKFSSSDALIHVEPFDSTRVNRVMFSISTKIGDCLNSGIPLFVYGPDCVASISLFIDEKHSFVCTNRNYLKETLLRMIEDIGECELVVNKQVVIAKKFFDKNKNSKQLKSILDNVSTKCW